MTTVQVTVNRDAGVAIARTTQAHGRIVNTNRSLFHRANRQILQLTN